MTMGDDSREALFPGSGEMARLMRVKDWAPTPVGDPARLAAEPADRGPDHADLALRDVDGVGPRAHVLLQRRLPPMTLGAKHPVGARPPARARCGREIWPDIGPRIEQVLDDRRRDVGRRAAAVPRAQRLSRRRPTTRSRTARCTTTTARSRGMLCVVTEETERVIGERRLALLRDLAAALGRATTPKPSVLAAVERSLDARSARPAVHADLPVRRRRRASARLVVAAPASPPDHPAAPASIDAAQPTPPWPLRRGRCERGRGGRRR